MFCKNTSFKDISYLGKVATELPRISVEDLPYIKQYMLDHLRVTNKEGIISQYNLEKIDVQNIKEVNKDILNLVNLFNYTMTEIMKYPKENQLPPNNTDIESLIKICRDKNVIMFGEQHSVQTLYYFTKNILPELIEKNFTTIVFEGLPYDFDSEEWNDERTILYQTGKITPAKTPKLYEVFHHTADPYCSIFFIEECIRNNMNLIGANPTLRMAKGLNAKACSMIIKENLTDALDKIPYNAKVIFYTGSLHNKYRDEHYDVGVRESLDVKFGRNNVLSVDIINSNENSVYQYFTRFFLRNTGNSFPVVVPVGESNTEYLIMLNKTNLNSIEKFSHLGLIPVPYRTSINIEQNEILKYVEMLKGLNFSSIGECSLLGFIPVPSFYE